MTKSNFAFILILFGLFILVFTACDKDDDNTCTETTWYEDADGDGLGNPDVSQQVCEQPTGYVSNSDDTDDTGVGTVYSIDDSYFNSSSLISFSTVSCTLENGSATTCYELVFSSNPVENGPYCPQTINDIGGVGIYDGNTNPGFQVMKQSLWDAMAADGYDVVDADGNINIVDPGDMSSPPPSSSGSCLEAAPDDNLILTFLIPTNPELLSSPDVLQTVENIGVSLDGIPLTGDPPSVVNGPGGMGGGIPSIDPCGGHMDPFGYYHLHFAPQEMNNVLAAHNITEVSCTNFSQSETALVGFAKDGFPIYASKDSDGTLPSDLDSCNGHTAPTADFPDGIYHYHASSTEAPNVPACLVGVSANNAFTYQ